MLGHFNASIKITLKSVITFFIHVECILFISALETENHFFSLKWKTLRSKLVIVLHSLHQVIIVTSSR